MSGEPEGSRSGISSRLGGLVRGMGDYLYSLFDLGDLKEISRRYAVTNIFDSVLMMLGIILGSYSTGVSEPSIVVGLISAGALSIFLSGSIGTYISERAERELKIKELERAVLMALEETVISKLERGKAVIIALMSGGVPSIVVMLLSLPFHLCRYGILEIKHSYMSSVAEALALLFIMGTYLGSLSGRNRIIYALSTLGAGILLVVVTIWLGVK
ncbi:MAG: hypothetical protein QXO55_00240 [Candidatus Korarchaeum sp.]